MFATILAWAMAQPADSRAHALAEAFTGGYTRVTFEGRTVEYRSLRDIERALEALYAADNAASRRPSMTIAVVGDGFR